MCCVLETLFTKELLPRSPTIYTAELTHQRSYCRTGNECSRPSPSANSNSLLPKLVINPKSTVILGWIWDSGTLQAFLHQIAVLPLLQQAQNSWPPKVLYWCVQSLALRYTPVLHISVNTRHSSQVASLTRGLTCVMIYSHPFTVVSLPFPQATSSSSPAPMINYGSSPTVLSKLQELVLLCTSPVTISYS